VTTWTNWTSSPVSGSGSESNPRPGPGAGPRSSSDGYKQTEPGQPAIGGSAIRSALTAAHSHSLKDPSDSTTPTQTRPAIGPDGSVRPELVVSGRNGTVRSAPAGPEPPVTQYRHLIIQGIFKRVCQHIGQRCQESRRPKRTPVPKLRTPATDPCQRGRFRAASIARQAGTSDEPTESKLIHLLPENPRRDLMALRRRPTALALLSAPTASAFTRFLCQASKFPIEP